ncbi:MAG: penicillin-binding protein 2 [Rhodovarius sp.]|nr:penicillin-binding protein 2 [Rhodovarius sp.]
MTVELAPPAPAPDASPAGRAQGRPIASELVRIGPAPGGTVRGPAVPRGRIVFAAAGFGLLFALLALKATDATLISPILPRPPAPLAAPAPPTEAAVSRAPILDRNGEVLAVSVRGIALYARPHLIEQPALVARQLHAILPHLSVEHLTERLSHDGPWVYIDRFISADQQERINRLGHIGLGFEPSERRQYPRGREAAHVLGSVGADGEARGGVEEFLDERLRLSREPLRLSIDIRIQREMREAVEAQRAYFSALGGAAIMMDIRNGEILGLVSNPDFSAADLSTATGQALFNRVTTGVYEPGSTFKLLTAAMALDAGVVTTASGFDASRPIQLPQGRTITDFRGQNRWLSVPEIVAYSSNIGTAHMAMALGRRRHQEYIERFGLLDRPSLELPGRARPLYPRGRNWSDVSTMTIGYGHGIAVTPLQVITAVAAIANGGVLIRPTLIAQEPGSPPPEGQRVISERTSEIMRRIMRLAVTHGSGTRADAPGYFVGGKTGTAQKLSERGQYMRGRSVVSFVGVFPIHEPRYALYVMLDEPRARAETQGFATAGWIATPLFRRIVERTAPMLGLTPETEPRASAIQASLAMPLNGRIGSAPPRQPAPAPAAPPGVPMAGSAPRPAGQAAAPAAPAPAGPAHLAPRRPAEPPAAARPPAPPGFEPAPGAPIRRTEAPAAGPRVVLAAHPPAPGESGHAPR